MRTSVRRRLAACALSLGLGAAVVAAPAPASAATLPEGTLATAIANFVASPDRLAGVNDWSCKPSAAHPEPVIIQHATFVNFGSNFVKLAPRLKNAGYCVFAENYGMTALSLQRIGGLGRVQLSVDQFGRFVDRVRAATGAAKVDVVGHSQGGLIPFAYIKQGGAAKIDDYVSWGGTQHGTTLNGLASLGSAFRVLGLVEVGAALLQAPGLTDQAVGSAFQRTLQADPSVPAGPDYTTIATKYDTVSTPYTSQALAGANNIVIQDRCPTDRVGHVGLFLDEPTIQLTMNALAGGPDDFQPSCSGFGPQV
ncbi:MAG: lipase [Aeromicrobium erythreum]